MSAQLRSGELEAEVVPEDGMLVAALRHRGLDYLAARADAWTGSPLLHPWANRLSAERFDVRGRAVDATGARRDENGVPLHGLPAARRGWVLEHADDTRIRARRAWRDDAFPFPHEVVVEHRLSARGLETVTDVRGDTPVAFGWHPFLRLPGVPRERWRVTLGSRRRLVLDDRLLPTGASEPWAPAPFALADGHYDEALVELDGGFVLEGDGRRVELEILEGAPCAQFFAPLTEPVACFEPMAAPVDALVSGERLEWAPWRMRFEIRIG
ncbi:MAG TPA: aldose 1-epimerase [Thermoleophilaceae bacterium]|nr:aldose 1-epimerase [Thermoleophilaceae bacterium]